MISSSKITSDSNDLKQKATDYITKVQSVDGNWTGVSKDSLFTQSDEFKSTMEKVSSQLSSFASAVQAFESYKETKDQYKEYEVKYNSTEDEAEKSSYKQKMNECESKMKELKPQIDSALNEAGSFKMEGVTSLSTGNSSGMFVMVDANGNPLTNEYGEFIEDPSRGVYGRFLSSIDGLEHTIYNQSQIKGWATDCNRAAAASIASAYANYAGEAVDIAKGSKNGIGYDNDVTNQYFSNFGLTANVTKVNDKYDTVKSDLVNNLNNGNYVMFDLANGNVHGQSGQKWSNLRHWVSVLDIKKTGDGENDYAIFVSSSAHGASTADHGYGKGWYSIDEFDGQDIACFTTVGK